MKSTSLSVPVLFTILLPAATAFMHNNSSPQQNSLSRQNESSVATDKGLNLFRSAQEATAEAERICLVEGPHSDRCKVAWDIVEELKAADAHVRTPSAEQGGFNYTPMVNSLEILTSKLDKKLDELRKLSEGLAEAGAGPEVERLIYASDEMKQVIEEANRAMDIYR